MALATKRFVREAILHEPEHPRRLQRVGGVSFPWGEIVFGYSISGTVLTLKAGEIHHSDNTIVEVAERDLDFDGLSLADGDYYAFVKYTLGGTAEWWSPPATDRPTNEDGIERVWFYIFTWADPVLTRKASGGVGHFGNIRMPGAFGG